MNLTPADIANALKDAPITCQIIAHLLNAGDEAEAGRILREQATFVRDFTAKHSAATPATPRASSLPPGEARLAGRDLPTTQEDLLAMVVEIARSTA
jgi:hypothetical protein